MNTSQWTLKLSNKQLWSYRVPHIHLHWLYVSTALMYIFYSCCEIVDVNVTSLEATRQSHYDPPEPMFNCLKSNTYPSSSTVVKHDWLWRQVSIFPIFCINYFIWFVKPRRERNGSSDIMIVFRCKRCLQFDNYRSVSISHMHLSTHLFLGQAVLTALHHSDRPEVRNRRLTRSTRVYVLHVRHQPASSASQLITSYLCPHLQWRPKRSQEHSLLVLRRCASTSASRGQPVKAQGSYETYAARISAYLCLEHRLGNSYNRPTLPSSNPTPTYPFWSEKRQGHQHGCLPDSVSVPVHLSLLFSFLLRTWCGEACRLRWTFRCRCREENFRASKRKLMILSITAIISASPPADALRLSCSHIHRQKLQSSNQAHFIT